jgi:hypothetical protein
MPLEFHRGAIELPPGGHLQGIQMRFDAARNRHLAFLSHDSATAGYLVVVEFPADLSADGRILGVHTFPSDGQSPPLRHAGGIQLVDDVLAVGLEDNHERKRSQIQFWSVADPAKLAQLDHLTIRRAGSTPEDMTAGAVGIVRRAGDHLLAVANWDSRAIDFYTSNGKPLADRGCRFEHLFRWRDDAAEKRDWRPDAVFGRYQAVNLLADAGGNLLLVAFHTAAADLADLYAIDVVGEPSQVIRKLAAKSMRLAGGSHFQYSGGIALLPTGPAILSSQRNLGNPTRLSIAR